MTTIPGMRFMASPMLASGKRPIWSDATTLVTLGALSCWFSAAACPTRWPVTVTPSTSMASVRISKRTAETCPAATVTVCCTDPYPR